MFLPYTSSYIETVHKEWLSGNNVFQESKIFYSSKCPVKFALPEFDGVKFQEWQKHDPNLGSYRRPCLQESSCPQFWRPAFKKVLTTQLLDPYKLLRWCWQSGLSTTLLYLYGMWYIGLGSLNVRLPTSGPARSLHWSPSELQILYPCCRSSNRFFVLYTTAGKWASEGDLKIHNIQ